jgi:hypothetical protein
MCVMRADVRLAGLMAAVSMLWAGAARAEGSLGLDEVLRAVRSAPRLVHEIEVELRKRDIKVGQVVCVAARHDSEWTFLGGGRAAPYECRIGDRMLKVNADRVYYDINGKRLGQPGSVPDKVLLTRAKSFQETNMRWTWSDP